LKRAECQKRLEWQQRNGAEKMNKPPALNLSGQVPPEDQFARTDADAEDRLDTIIDALQKIQSWSESYPVDIFPEPDLKRAAELLNAGGITLDAVSASTARKIIKGVGEIARDALKEVESN
jgi:hypothetical protein